MSERNFSKARNIELSLLTYLETSIATDWNDVTIVKEFTHAYKSTLPVVAVNALKKDSSRVEVGSDTLIADYVFEIHIFAKSSGMRIDLAEYIENLLKTGFTYYVFSKDSGNNKDLQKTASGTVRIKSFLENTKLNFGEETDLYDRFRHYISFSIRK